MFDVFIKGKAIDLIVLDEQTVENSNWYKWFNDEDNMKMMQKHYFPNTKSMQMHFFKTEIENNKSKIQLGIVHKKDSKLIGVISLNDIDYLNRKCEISGFIGEKEYQNFELYTEANKLIIKHAFDNLNIHKIYGGTLIKEISLMYCRALGFTEEGIKKSEIYKNGEYYDVYLIGLLRDEYCAKLKSGS